MSGDTEIFIQSFTDSFGRDPVVISTLLSSVIIVLVLVGAGFSINRVVSIARRETYDPLTPFFQRIVKLLAVIALAIFISTIFL